MDVKEENHFTHFGDIPSEESEKQLQMSGSGNAEEINEEFIQDVICLGEYRKGDNDENGREFFLAELAENEEQLHLIKDDMTRLTRGIKRKLRDLNIDYARGEDMIVSNSSSDEEDNKEIFIFGERTGNSCEENGSTANPDEEVQKVQEEILKTSVKLEGECAGDDDGLSEGLNAIIGHEISEISVDLEEGSRRVLSDDNACQSNQFMHYYPEHLVGLIYQLDLTIFCLLRKSVQKEKCSSLSVTFGDSEVGQFNYTVLRRKRKSVYIKVENVGNNSFKKSISYERLFPRRKDQFKMNNYLDCFVKLTTSTSDQSSGELKYFIVHTNCPLEVTEENVFKGSTSKHFYPLKFDVIDVQKCRILKNFLLKNCNQDGHGFYRFSKDGETREKLTKRLEFSTSTRNQLKEKNLSQEEVRDAFLDKLVFAVNQPNREELRSIIRDEMKENMVPGDYVDFQEEVLNSLEPSEKDKKYKKLIKDTLRILYEFYLLVSVIHDMTLEKKVFSVNFIKQSYDLSNAITVSYKGKIICLKAYETETNISYGQLFPIKKQEKDRNMFFVNKHFTFFLEELRKNVKFFILYTNARAELTERMILMRKRSKDFNVLQFARVDVREKKFRALRQLSCIKEEGLYQFSREEATRGKLLELLKLAPSFQSRKSEGTLCHSDELELKEEFLDKLVFAVGQPDRKELSSLIRNRASQSTPFDDEHLQEITLRWLESYKFGPLTKETMKTFLHDVKSNRSSYQPLQDENIDEEIKFAKIVVGGDWSLEYKQFLDFLIRSKVLKFLKKEGINPPSMSNLLSQTGSNALKIFKALFNLWFDKQGNKTYYLKILDRNEVKLTNMSGVLSGVKDVAVQAYKDLFHLWFDSEGNKSQYLETLQREGVSLTSVSSILAGSRFKAVTAFKELYDLWFDKEGKKTVYLRSFQKEKINLSRVTSILSGAGTKAATTFREFYNIFFDREGNKTECLKNLDKAGVSLSNVSGILNGASIKGPQAFKDLYNLWFDSQGNKTRYLKNLEEKEINLANISSILNGAKSSSATVFKEFYNLLFDEKGNKTKRLKALEAAGVSLTNMSCILNRTGRTAPKIFMDLYNIWFDEEGKRSQYLETLKKEGINLNNITGILHGVGGKAPKAFKSLYDLLFDSEGNKTKYLKTLEEAGINLANMSSILNGANTQILVAFEDLYNLWFDMEGNKTRYLTSLEEEGVNLSNMTSILHGAGAKAPGAFKGLYDLWFDEEGRKSEYLKTLEETGVNLSSLSCILHGVGAEAPIAFRELFHLWFDTKVKKSFYLITLEEQGVNLTHISNILSGTGAKASKAFRQLFHIWFDEEGNKKKCLKNLEKGGITLANVSSILGGAKINAVSAFEELYDLWLDAEGNKKECLLVLEKTGVDLTNMSCILSGAGAKAPKAFRNLYSMWFDKKGNQSKYLKSVEEQGIKLSSMSSVLCGAGVKAPEAFKDLYRLWFDEDGNKTQYLKTLEKSGIRLSNLTGILCGAGAKACVAFKHLYELWFDAVGEKSWFLETLEKAGINLTHVSGILHGAGTNAPGAFVDLYNLWFDKEGNKREMLAHFMEKKDWSTNFTLNNLSSILNGAGAKASEAFRKFHDLCFDKKGERTEFLENFYSAGFQPRNITYLLSGSGDRAPSTLKKVHAACFNEKGERTKVLDNFYGTGFENRDLCLILSGTAGSIERFHNFCFLRDSRIYLRHFLKAGFTGSEISQILQGARSNVCSALEDLHNVCFDADGNRTEILNDFQKVGFVLEDISGILSLTANSAASVLKKFHKFSFGKKYLVHFLSVKEIFTSNSLCELLRGTGTNLCSIFKKLHKLCFDKSGNKKDFLRNLLQKDRGAIFTLYKSIRGNLNNASLEDTSNEEYLNLNIQEGSQNSENQNYRKKEQEIIYQSDFNTLKRKVEIADDLERKSKKKRIHINEKDGKCGRFENFETITL